MGLFTPVSDHLLLASYNMHSVHRMEQFLESCVIFCKDILEFFLLLMALVCLLRQEMRNGSPLTFLVPAKKMNCLHLAPYPIHRGVEGHFSHCIHFCTWLIQELKFSNPHHLRAFSIFSFRKGFLKLSSWLFVHISPESAV